MKSLSIIAPAILASIIFALIYAVLNSSPSTAAVEGSFTVPLSGAPAEAIAMVESVVDGTDSLQTPSLDAYPGLDQFARDLANGRAEDVVGIYVRDIMALPVTQQPDGMPDYVASDHNLLTEFSVPRRFGTIGLLAHNYLSGSRFTQLPEGTEIVLVFGDGRVARYQVKMIDLYQALDPNSPVSDFVHPNDPTGKVITSGELFQRVYTGSNRLVLQTCVEAYGDPSWGRMFVIAEPLGPVNLSVPQVLAPGLN